MFRPGAEHRYSIYGRILLSVLVERVAAEPFPGFMTRELFGPLGMESTVLEECGPRPGQHHHVLQTGRSHARRCWDSEISVKGALLLSCRSGRVSLHAVGPGPIRIRDAEARVPEGRNYRHDAGATPARIRKVH